MQIELNYVPSWKHYFYFLIKLFSMESSNYICLRISIIFSFLDANNLCFVKVPKIMKRNIEKIGCFWHLNELIFFHFIIFILELFFQSRNRKNITKVLYLYKILNIDFLLLLIIYSHQRTILTLRNILFFINSFRATVLKNLRINNKINNKKNRFTDICILLSN